MLPENVLVQLHFKPEEGHVLDKLNQTLEEIEHKLRESIEKHVRTLHTDLATVVEELETPLVVKVVQRFVKLLACCCVALQPRRQNLISARRHLLLVATCAVNLRVKIGNSTGDYMEAIAEALLERHELTKEEFSVIERFLELRSQQLCENALQEIVRPFDKIYFFSSGDVNAMLVNFNGCCQETAVEVDDDDDTTVVLELDSRKSQ